jgi:hypothetical protein
MKVAFLIGVEQYADKHFSPVRYAKNDVGEFSQAIAELGFNSDEQMVLIGAQATKANIETELGNVIRLLSPDDSFFLYYVGHGVVQHGQNYLSCHDTKVSDLIGSSISLSSLFERLASLGTCKTVLFIDAGQSESHSASELKQAEIQSAEEQWSQVCGNNSICLVSCKPGEASWPDSLSMHSAWAAHVIAAFNGTIPAACKHGSQLTATSLQNYLRQALPRSLRKAYADKKVQTPVMYGTVSDEFSLADLSCLPKQRESSERPQTEQILRVALIGEHCRHVKTLSGFKKTHRVPDEVNHQSETFVAAISADEIDRDLDQVFAALRKEFRFKRADMDISKPDDGTGTIITPYFNYSITASLNPDDPAEVIWHRQVSELKEADQVLSVSFAKVFSEVFDTLEFSPATIIDLEELIDRIEALDDDLIGLEYDKDVTWCELTIQGIEGVIAITPRTVSIVHPQPTAAKSLLKSFFDFQVAVVDRDNNKMINFDDR